jgi:Flp pilus assembly protein TadD
MKPNRPGQPRQPPPALEHALQSASFALQGNRPAEAQWIAADALKTHPGEPRALQILGYALLVQGKAAEAIAPLEQAARRSHDPGAEMQLAVALNQAGRGEDARARLARAIKRRPAFPPAFSELAQQLTALGRQDEAIDVLKSGLALVPNAAELAVQLGYLYAARNEPADARAAFTQALRVAPRHPDALFGLALATQRDGAYAEAAEIFQRMLAVKPDEPAARIGFGACLMELGQTEAAFASFRMAEQSAPHMLGQMLTALASSGRGRFWLKRSDALRAIKGEGK